MTDNSLTKLIEVKKYFECRAIDDNELKNAVPELLKVIEDLRPLQKSQKQTDNYINNWRKTKYKEYVYLPNENGDRVEVFNNNPDMAIHDRFVNWLFDYFRKLHENETGKTIGYAYALDALTVYHNRQILNKRILDTVTDRPNINIDYVFDAIEEEGKQPTVTKVLKTNTLKPQREIKEAEIRILFRQKLNNKKKEGTRLSEADIIISNLRIDRKSNIDYAKIALLFYNSKYVSTEKSFRYWLSQFYDLIGIENGTRYDPNKLTASKELQTEFQYLL